MNYINCLYYRLGRVVVLNIVTGELRESSSNVFHGWVSEIGHGVNRIVVAIYGSGEVLYFQVGSRRWSIEENRISFACNFVKFTFGFLRRFQATTGDGKTLFSITYLNPYWKHPLNWVDFTYDELDAELDDFFLWAHENCNDPASRSEFAIRMTQGFPAT